MNGRAGQRRATELTRARKHVKGGRRRLEGREHRAGSGADRTDRPGSGKAGRGESHAQEHDCGAEGGQGRRGSHPGPGDPPQGSRPGGRDGAKPRAQPAEPRPTRRERHPDGADSAGPALPRDAPAQPEERPHLPRPRRSHQRTSASAGGASVRRTALREEERDTQALG